tara:strand:+ start:144 stop:1073 length:930 start_codon:yes stop_codon:yes gene_type:complete
MKILITGGAGQIAYSLIPLLLSRNIFNTKIDLILLDIEPCMEKLEGVKMELEDSNFEYLNSLIITSDLKTAFSNIDMAILLGGFPRLPGMERKDLLEKNFEIFKIQGDALNNYAKPNVKVLVVANPVNTNCWITNKFSPNIPSENFTSYSYLDQERLAYLLQNKYNQDYENIKNIVIWGNHSSTMVPDVSNYNNELKLNEDDIFTIQNRGASVIEKRKLSSAMSAANGIIKHITKWFHGSNDEIISFGVYNTNSYKFPEDMFISMPVKTYDNFNYSIVNNLQIDNSTRKLIEISIKELKDEIDLVKKLL